MPAPIYYMLCGLPATGKSTFVKKVLDKNPDYIHISSDKYIEAAAEKAGKRYNDVFQEVSKDAMRQMESERLNSLMSGKSIIHDQTNLSVAKRKKLLSSIPAGYVKVAVIFNPDKEMHRAFIESRPEKRIPEHIMESMAKTFEMPTMDEGFNSVFVYNYSE